MSYHCHAIIPAISASPSITERLVNNYWFFQECFSPFLFSLSSEIYLKTFFIQNCIFRKGIFSIENSDYFHLILRGIWFILKSYFELNTSSEMIGRRSTPAYANTVLKKEENFRQVRQISVFCCCIPLINQHWLWKGNDMNRLEGYISASNLNSVFDKSQHALK